jgi:hypothetical protein
LRVLLDQNVPEEIALVFQALHHIADHTAQLKLERAPDEDIATVARQYDVLVTIDLHRQEPEWLDVNRAIVEHGIKVLRLRPPKPKPAVRALPEWFILMVIRQLTYEMEAWLDASQADAVLVTIAREEKAFRQRTREEVEAILGQRQKPD